MTVGYYSPMPPAPTGVADYAAALFENIRARGNVELAPAECDIALYHLGNNPLHSAVYRRSLEHPGVTVLHDATLHHFLLGELDERAYVDEFVYNYGEWNRGLAKELWQGRSSSASGERYFARPMLRRALERARAVVVHNAEAAHIARAHAEGVRIVEIPHLFAPPSPAPSSEEVLRFRRDLGAGGDAVLFGFFGFLRESKRLMQILDVFAEVRRGNPRVALLVAGEFVSPDLARAAADALAGPGVIRRPYLPEREFWLAAAAVDACINLRSPSAGETSGVTIRLMGLGKPVLVTDSKAVSGFPEGSCVRVAAGIKERESLKQNMLLLTLVPDTAVEIGRIAARHISERHSLEDAGKQYWDLLCDCCT